MREERERINSLHVDFHAHALHTFTVDILDDEVFKVDRLFNSCNDLTMSTSDQHHV